MSWKCHNTTASRMQLENENSGISNGPMRSCSGNGPDLEVAVYGKSIWGRVGHQWLGVIEPAHLLSHVASKSSSSRRTGGTTGGAPRNEEGWINPVRNQISALIVFARGLQCTRRGVLTGNIVLNKSSGNITIGGKHCRNEAPPQDGEVELKLFKAHPPPESWCSLITRISGQPNTSLTEIRKPKGSELLFPKSSVFHSHSNALFHDLFEVTRGRDV
ncbi:hypothetical protein B0H13DRAFT_1877618 [Mycena leptocephala]|nr:hypothetical protein B0H13DRAFT_1877618 [Mycena leptocephala]